MTIKIIKNQLRNLFTKEKIMYIMQLQECYISHYSLCATHIYSPPGNKEDPLRMLLFDCWYERHRGVVCLFVVLDGTISQGMCTSGLFV